jgi:cellulose synthase/poly-beta-1,6-N-acetylglucosamine synthase-like glycosyltransferase
MQNRNKLEIKFTSNLAGYLFIKAFFLIHVLKEQLGDILFISFVIASGEAIIFYFE